MNPLTFCVEQTDSETVALPGAAYTLCGFDNTHDFELRTAPGVLVVLKQQMTAMDLINAIDTLLELAAQYGEHLSEVCGECGECGQCPYDGPPREEVDITDELREAAGLSPDHKIAVEADRGNQRLILSDAGYAHDLRDVPEYLADMFICGGVALCYLDQHLRKDDFIYGGK